MQQAESQAGVLVNGERMKDYDHPWENFEKITGMLNALGYRFHRTDGEIRELQPKDVPILMICTKLSREVFKHKDDNVVDIHGYLVCLAKVYERMEKNRVDEVVGEPVEIEKEKSKVVWPMLPMLKELLLDQGLALPASLMPEKELTPADLPPLEEEVTVEEDFKEKYRITEYPGETVLTPEDLPDPFEKSWEDVDASVYSDTTRIAEYLINKGVLNQELWDVISNSRSSNEEKLRKMLEIGNVSMTSLWEAFHSK